MAHWTKPSEAEELTLSKPWLWMNGPSSYEEWSNYGYIEVVNDSSDDENKQGCEKSHGGSVAGMKERAKVDVEKRSPKSRKSNK